MTMPAGDPARSSLPQQVTSTSATFLDVDAEILEQALTLIRDKFRLATDATIFLELKTRTSGINSGIANQRDATSHLATLLKMRGAKREELRAQLNHIEEHMRRAVMEPYEKTVQLLQKQFLEQLPRYKDQVLTLPGVQERLPNALSLQQIDTSLAAIDQLCAEGRRAKLENSWSTAWEQGVKHFISAVTELEKLHNDVEGYLIKADQIRREQELKALSGEQIEATRRAADEQIAEARIHAARGKRRAYLLLPISALLGLVLKILWDWYSKTATTPPAP